MTRSPGAVLRTLRERAGLTTTQVAQRARVSESYLRRVESGEAEPSDAWVGFIASILADALIEDPAPPPTSEKA